MIKRFRGDAAAVRCGSVPHPRYFLGVISLFRGAIHILRKRHRTSGDAREYASTVIVRYNLLVAGNGKEKRTHKNF